MTSNLSSRKTLAQKTRQQEIGQRAEALARQFLEQQGMSLIQCNFRCKVGEIDLIMLSPTHLVFVEVRYRRSAAFGDAASSVTSSKQRKLIKAAQYYLLCNSNARNQACRFDVIGIDFQQGEHHINWIKDAFS